MKIDVLDFNQTVVYYKNKTIFFSYNTPVVVEVDGEIYKTEQFFSVTTSKHIKNYLGEDNYKNAIRLPQETIERMIDEECQ